jgi:hypothetical protein
MEEVKDNHHHYTTQPNSFHHSTSNTTNKLLSTSATPATTAASSSSYLSQSSPIFEAPTTNQQPQGIQSIQILYDLQFGHIAIIHLQPKGVTVINLTIHMKLCQLHNQLTSQLLPSDTSSSLLKQLQDLTSDDYLRYQISKNLLEKVITGLKNIPSILLEVNVSNAKDNAALPVRYLLLLFLKTKFF